MLCANFQVSLTSSADLKVRTEHATESFIYDLLLSTFSEQSIIIN